MRDERGHTLALMAVVLASLSCAALLFSSSWEVKVDARPGDAVRDQALWLGRSALDAGITGDREVETPVGKARVRVVRRGTGASAEVDLQGARAVVTRDPPGERFEAKAARGDAEPGLTP